MGFNEKLHAFIAARFYVRLTEAFGERGRLAFVQGTQTYAEQRGKRMAKRAIRDGQELTFTAYLRYGEWMPTREMIDAGQSNSSTVEQWEPDYTIHIHRCPWHAQFAEMGLPEAGREYCRHLDNSICRGFNPYLTYLVPQTLHDCPYCIQTVPDAGLTAGADYSKHPDRVKPFEYHCAHSYWSYSATVRTIFGQAGAQIAPAVLDDIAEAWGRDAADTLLNYRHTDWLAID